MLKSWWGVLVCSLVACSLTFTVNAQSGIQALGLFKNTAILQIDGKQRILKVGQKSPEGVRLLTSNAQGATLEYQGNRFILGLTEQISANFSEVKHKSFSIRRDLFGHYKTTGFINGKKVNVLLDTGASFVAMNSHHAKQLGIRFSEHGKRQQVATASGMVDAYAVMLDKVTVGGIEVHNVYSSVIEGNFPRDILLGMTFLNHVDMRERSGIMRLEALH